ncbi:MAG TPA: HemK/PrmC family methyltransferase [Polyangia bacterium]|nr:HemK/PrmC family methyltransferase [Polyangia bacterium]
MAVPSPPEKPSSAASAAPARWTVKDVLLWTTSRFEERGLPTPRLDAEVLTAHALSLPRLQLYVQFDRPLLPDELAAIRESVKRRQAGESVAYVIGKKEFWGLDFAVDARVLVPRPDTETLIDEALERVGRALRARVAPRAAEARPAAAAEAADAYPTDAANAEPAAPPPPSARPAPRIADVGTGSGAIAVTLAKERPDAVVFAVDVSPDALAVARANALRHAVTVTFLEGDLEVPLLPHAPFDLIAANLPYIPSRDLAGLPPAVRAEPARALDGGADGLALVRRLVAAAPALLARGGALVLEIGAGQAPETARLCGAAGLADVRVRRDLGAIERVVSAVRA